MHCFESASPALARIDLGYYAFQPTAQVIEVYPYEVSYLIIILAHGGIKIKNPPTNRQEIP
jgi:hypothetical protein